MNKKEAREIATQIRYMLFAPEEELQDTQVEMINNFLHGLLLKCESILGQTIPPSEYEHSILGRKLK